MRITLVVRLWRLSNRYQFGFYAAVLLCAGVGDWAFLIGHEK